MNALHGTLHGALTMRLSSAARKWMGEAAKFGNLRPVVSVEPPRLQMSTTRSRQSDYSTTGSPTFQRSSGSQGRRAFADYTFYKGKGAMSMKPGKPVFRSLDAGGAALEREGSMYLEFAPALGPRQYDWGQKQPWDAAKWITMEFPVARLFDAWRAVYENLRGVRFSSWWRETDDQLRPSVAKRNSHDVIMALSVLELGTLVGLTMGENCEFFHDPFMGKSDAGKIRKVLKVEPMNDQTGYFFNFNVSNKMEGSDIRVTIALTRAEYSVLRSSVNYIIPYLMGWHMIADPSKLDDFLSDGTESNAMSTNEWNK